MMYRPHSALQRLLVLFTISLASLAAVAATAQASAVYGELERFGEKGAELGQLQNPEPAFGVDPTDNSVFVVDELNEYSSFRIQKFSKVGGKYTEVASHEFTPPDASGNEELGTVEGVAVDPTLERVYVLSLQDRGEKKVIEPETETASALYAFKTSNLESAVTGESQGILAGPTTLQTESKELGVPLLEPSGITVDPENHNVVILAYVPRKNSEHEVVKITALQQITSAGALGPKWVDGRTIENPQTHLPEEVSYFGECECVTSPIATSGGKIYVRAHVEEEEENEVGRLSEIAEIPKSFSSTEAPTYGFRDPLVESISEFVAPARNAYGGALSIGAEGHVYAMARIENAKEGKTKEQGVVLLNSGLEELGWTGAQPALENGSSCAIQQGKGNEWPVLAAGKDETLFVLDREFASPSVVVFGPGGHGCPATEATVPTAEAGGEKNLQHVLVKEKVTLESQLTGVGDSEPQADALSVEWNFGDGTQETVSARQSYKSVVQHEFKAAGLLTVTETIHTDDLASPEVKVERKLEVDGAPAVVTGEGTVTGVNVALNGTVNPFGQTAKCEFEYGTSTQYGSTVKCAKAPEGEEPVSVSAKLSGLAASTTYHFRLVAESNLGLTEGKDATFKTAAAPTATVSTEPATAVELTSATVRATVNPEGTTLTKCEFQYGTSEALGSGTPCGSLPGVGSEAVAVSATLTGLNAGTPYYYRIVAENSGGASYGHIVKFVTGTPPPQGCQSNCGTNTGPPPPPPPSPAPAVTLQGAAATVAATGAFTIKASCPAGVATCSGTVMVQTVNAVVAKAKHKAAILTLASGAFTLAGGQTKALTLHLSSKGRALLARLHVVKARVTVIAHDPSGGSHTTVVVVTLRATKGKRHH